MASRKEQKQRLREEREEREREAAATARRRRLVGYGAGGALALAAVAAILVAGAGVGAMTGFFGVGGGFLIVPVLTLWLGARFRRAVATSLVILTLTGAAALASHLATGSGINVPVTIALSSTTAVGALLGTIVGRRLPQRHLGRAFALVVTAVALFLTVDTLFLGGPPSG